MLAHQENLINILCTLAFSFKETSYQTGKLRTKTINRKLKYHDKEGYTKITNIFIKIKLMIYQEF